MKKNLLLLSFLLVGCGSVVSSETTSLKDNSSITSIEDNTSINDSINTSTSLKEEKVLNVNLVNNYIAVHLDDNEKARNDIFSRFNDILTSTSYQKVDLDNNALKILANGKWTLDFKYSLTKISLIAKIYSKTYQDYQTGKDVTNIDSSKLYINNVDVNLNKTEYDQYEISFEDNTSSLELTSLEGRSYIESMKIYYVI